MCFLTLFMKNLKRVFIVLFFGILVTFAQNSVYAESTNAGINSDSVELYFTIGQNKYTSKDASKELDVAPLIQEDSTLVPFRVILEELGFSIGWDEESASIVATRGTDNIKLQIGNKVAIVNGVEKEMAVAPKIIGERTVVPLRFVAENSGANVVWDGATKSIYITRIGQYDTGKIMFYEKQSNNNNIHIYDGKIIETISIDKNEVMNWYTYKGQILLTIFDKATNNNKFVIYRNNKFDTLIDNFDIKDTFEYNNNLLIHGYDRSQKINKLYRFDGKNLTLIKDDFCVGQHIIFNDKLLINKYDNKRNYTLLVFDKKSWASKELRNGFVINKSLVNENILYLSGAWQEGLEKPLASYDGKSTDSSSFKILHSNLPKMDLDNLVFYKSKVYYIESGVLKKIDNGINDVYLNDNSRLLLKYSIKSMKVYNDKLYIGITSAQAVDYDEKEKKYKTIAWPKDVPKVVASILVTDDVKDVEYLISEFSLTQFYAEDNNLLMLGKNKTVESVLYIYNDTVLDSSEITEILDVVKIKDILPIKEKMFLSVQEIDRITQKIRDNMILFEDNSVTNLAANVDIKKWENINGNMILSGYEKDIKRNKLYSYGTVFNELMGNFEIKYWNKFSNGLFINGYDQDTKIYNLFRFVNDENTIVKENIEVINMIKTKGSYYLVYATDRDSKSLLNGKKVLYVYNDIDKKFTKIKENIIIADMIFIE